MPTRRRKDGRGRRVSEVYGSAGPTESPPRLFYQSQIPASEVLTESMPSFASRRLWADPKRTSAAAAKFSRKERQREEVNGPLTAKQSGAAGAHVAAIRAAPCMSSTSSESVVSLVEDFERYDMPFEKRRSAIAVVTGIFTCCSRNKDGRATGNFLRQSRQHTSASTAPQRLGSLSTAALVERARAQQEALSEIQDTSDMWEWHLEQQHAIASQEHEMCERTSNATSEAQVADSLAAAAAPPLLQCDGIRSKSTRPVGKLKSPPEEEYALKEQGWEEDDGALQNWGGPSWGWGHQDEVIAEKVMQMFETALLRYRWEVNVFCRVYMQQIVRAGYSLINTLMEMEANTVFLRRVHASYALEARINAALFRCFENDSFDDSGLTHIFDPAARAAARMEEFGRMKGLDPAEALRMHTASYEPAFHSFAAAKSEEVLALLPAAALAFRSAAQRDRFMDAFLRAAKCAWLLHRLATVTTPQTNIVRVGRGHPVDSVYVEAVAVPPIGSCPRCPVTAPPSVEFMIMPGFLAAQPGKVFRCRIYQHVMCKQLH